MRTLFFVMFLVVDIHLVDFLKISPIAELVGASASSILVLLLLLAFILCVVQDINEIVAH